MTSENEANQFAVISVEPGGGVTLDLFFLDSAAATGLRSPATVRLK